MRFGSALLAVSMLAAPAMAGAPIDGVWKTEDGNALVRIGSCGEALCGAVTRVLAAPAESDRLDVHNPEPALRARAIVGLSILTGFHADGAQWRGRIYDPKSGRTYRSILKRESANMLQVQGCLAFICQTQHWQRVG